MKKLILLGIIMLLLGTCIYLLVSRPPQTKMNIDALSPAEALQGLSESLGVKPELKEYNYADWKSTRGELFPLKGKEIILGTMSSNGIGNYTKITPDDLSSITIANLTPLLKATDSYFITHGFTKSTLNSTIEGTPPVTSTFIGYENGATKCVLRIDEQSDPFGNFACGVIDTAQYELQKPFTSLFLRNTDDDFAITSFRVSKVETDFARGSASGIYSGYEWIAKRKDDVWSIVWRGQEIPLCSEMMTIQIPKSIYNSCYLSDGTLN